MQNLFMSISKYCFIILMLLFVFLSYISLGTKSKKSHKGAILVQSFIMYTMHLLGFIVIYINNSKPYIILFYGLQIIYFVVYKGFYGVLYENSYNKNVLNNMCMMLTISFIMLTRLSFQKAIRQFAIVVVASILALVIPKYIRKCQKLITISYVYCFTGIAFLASVFVIGRLTYGAKLSITVLGFSFQPSEFVKILFVFFIASILHKCTDFKTIFISAVFAGMHVIILVLSNDLGSSLIFFLVYIMMLFVATGKVFYLAGGLMSGTLASIVAYKLFSHVRVRVSAFINPFSDIQGAGFQVAQSLFAIGTGGFVGLGLYKGLPTSIPFVAQDFIFSAISEEFGGFFAISLILLYACCFISFIRISQRQTVMFYKLVGLGITITFAVQTILTIGGAIKFIPSTGVTLPLISYGGSSVLCTITMFAIIQGLNLIIESDDKPERKVQKRG